MPTGEPGQLRQPWSGSPGGHGRGGRGLPCARHVLEIRGGIVNRSSWESEVSTKTVSGLVTDSKGIYDATTLNVSILHGLRSSRAGFDLTATGQQAMKLLTQLRWVNGVAQLADAVTKSAPSAKKGILEFFRRGQARSVVHARPVRRSARRGS